MRQIVCLCFAGFLCRSFAETSYLGLYLKGNKIGYSSYTSNPGMLWGRHITKTESVTKLDAGLLGQAMKVSLSSVAWITSDGVPIRMVFETSSGGRSNRVDATFFPKSVELKIKNGDTESHRSIPKPTDAYVVDDPLSIVLRGKLKRGTTRSFYVLDPSTASLMKNSVLYSGTATTQIGNRKIEARLIKVTDPTSVTEVFLNYRGDILRVNGTMGITMFPVSRDVALANHTAKVETLDLAETTRITPNTPINNPEELSRLKLKLSSPSVRNIPSDSYQTVIRSGHDWVIDIHPPQLKQRAGQTVAEAGKSKPEWLAPSLNIPCHSPKFRELARHILGQTQDARTAAYEIQLYVNQHMTFNAGIGVLRDASEVLETKEGVCRDFAILTVTLLRAAGIPARLASGLVNSDGAFYYHAWADAWDGLQWFGVDSVTDRAQLSASHVKLGEGNVETAFTFSFLDKAKIEVLDTKRD